jgi:hypothetical protein
MRQRLLETPAEQVPAALARLISAFCEPLGVIEAAFVGMTELTRDSGPATHQLAVAFALEAPESRSEEGDRELRLVTERFYEAMPAEVQAGGCNFLEPGAIPVWEEKAQRVYPVSAPSP